MIKKKLGNLLESTRNKQLRAELEKYKTWMPPGHFYSPIPDLNQVRGRESSIWKDQPDLKGIDLNEKEQLSLIDSFAEFYRELPFEDGKKPGLRYYFQNPFYTYCDSIFLYSMIRYLKPKRIIEIGSGFSSCVMLDTNELFFDKRIDCTFIEPYPDVLLSAIKEEDKKKIKLVTSNLQDVDLKVFRDLGENDILFVDSTHVSKIGSDVNYIFFEILPELKKGVYIHFHDIFFPFEYPKEWIYEGRAWNEAYLLRAFLQYNRSFEMKLFSTFLCSLHREVVAKKMPLCLKNPGGNIWLRKSSD